VTEEPTSEFRGGDFEDIPFEAEDLLNALNENTWKEYVKVMAKPNQGEEPKVAIEAIQTALDPDLGRAAVVEITGVGGLGKTTAAREYMKRVINRDYHDKPYDYYFYYTSKGEQGEIETTFGSKNFIRPAGWKEGGGTYIEKLGFNVFLKKICTSLDIEHTKEGLIDYLISHRILIVLDNFEDVKENESSYSEYVNFFQRIWVGKNQSRVIVTSRQQGQFSSTATEIKLQELDGIMASELIYKRYNYLNRNVDRDAGKNAFNYSEDVKNFIANYVNKKGDMVKDILELLKKNNHEKEEINLNLSHPVMLLRLSSILSSKIVKEATQSADRKTKPDILNILASIITDPDYGFLEYEKEVVAYIIKKAWDSLLHDSFCVAILKLLLEQGEEGLEHNSIKKRLQNMPEFQDEVSLIRKMDRAIEDIRDHSVFLDDEHVANDAIKLRTDARKNLEQILTENHAQKKQSEAVPKETKNLTDYFKLKGNFKTFPWKNFPELVRYFAIAKSHTGFIEELGLKNFREIESAIYTRLESTTSEQIRIYLSSFLDFMAASHRRDAGMRITIEHLDVLLESFESISREHLEMLCANWFGIGESLFQKVDQITRLQTLAMLLNRGVQQKADIIRSNFFALLSTIEPKMVEMAFDSSEERKLLNDRLDRYRNVVPWNMNVQKIFLRMKTQNYRDSKNDRGIPSLDCFVVNVLSELKKHEYEITHHPQSDTTHFDDNSTCYVTQVSHATKAMTLFIAQAEETISANKISEIDLTKFEDWLVRPTSMSPGLSPKPEILASDMLAVKEFYNQVFSNTDDVDILKLHPYRRAERFKKQFSKYHTTEDSAIATAFIVGHGVEHKTLDIDTIGQILTKETNRRLKIWPIPNLFFSSEEQRTKWGKHFEDTLAKAKDELAQNEGTIRTIMKSRERTMHKEVRKKSPTPKTKLNYNLGPKAMPATLQKLIHELAGTLMVSRNNFKQRLIQSTGGTRKNASEKKVIQEDWISMEEKLLVEAFWLEPICRVIFSRPLQGFTRYQEDDVEHLIREIMDTHIQSLTA